MKNISLLFMMCGLALLSNAGNSVAAEAGWESLFDGETLDGWVLAEHNGKAHYAVEDGAIVGTTVLGTPNSFLRTEKNYTDFVLELEFLVEEGMNSGIQIRSQSLEHYKDYRVHGYQVEIDTSARAWSGGIYDEARRGWLYNLKDKPAAQKAFKQNQWNHYRIMAVGDRIRTWVNGVPAADLKDDMTSTGFIALQVHSSKDAGKQIKWRNIRIQDLSRAGGQRPLKALIVDGQNNHNWEATTPVLRSLLKETGLFIVDVATSPAKGQPMDDFRPDFAKYDAVVCNYTGDEWPQATQDALVEYMDNGGGLVIFHAADNAFPKWKEWNEMIGVGGWGGRDEKSGPMVRYRDGKMVLDDSPGRGGTHGPQHAFQLVTRDRHHPITAGLPEKWMHASDELYSKLRGPAKNLHILATAYADPEKRGTGEHEPALFTIQYGKGRVFHTVLGHGPEQMRCVGFITTYQRGTEWAATGRVTQVGVPEDFPTADQVSLRPVITGNYEAITQYDFGKSRRELAAIEEEVRDLPVSCFPQVESRLLAAMQAEETAYAGKQFACRMLRRVGSAQSVPALAEMLADEELSHMARFALQYMAAPEAGDALRRAIDELDGELRIGVIGSIAQRKDRKAVGAIAELVRDTDRDTSRTAINALGRIGGTEAAAALSKANVPDKLAGAVDNALLMCADAMADEGHAGQAAEIYRGMTSPAKSTWIRIAAYKGLVETEKGEAVPHVLGLLKDKDIDLQRAAGRFMTEMPGSEITEALARQLDALNADGQVVLLGALEARGDGAAAAYVAEAVRSKSEAVQLAAVSALAAIGDGSNVELLAKTAAGSGAVAKAATESLTRMSGPDVGSALVKVARSDAPAEVRITAIEAIIDRSETEAVPTMFVISKDENRSVRQAAYKALGALGGQKEIAVMVSMLLNPGNASDRGTIERAISTILTRLENPNGSAITAGLRKANNDAKPHLLALLSDVGDARALQAAADQLDNQNGDVRKAAIRALADWPSPEPLEHLLKVARTARDRIEQILALRGYIRLLGVPANRGAAETVELLGKAMEASQRPEEKKAVLSALAKYPCQAGLAMAQAAKADASLRNEAELAATRIKEALVNRSLQVDASQNSGNARNALDGDPGTRWDTGRPMKPGDWFVLDLGVESTVKGLTLDTRNSANDYPRGYEVYVSFDGGSWGKPIVTSKQAKPLTEITFEEPVRTRFIKIVQTGSSDSWYWSIHELKVHLQ